MIIHFFDNDDINSHDNFQKWRRDNRDGYFINCKPNDNWMLHHVSCWHLGDTLWTRDEGGSLTKQKKICSNNKEELVEWARHNYGKSLKICSHCIF